jgi:hypothetical protein
VHPLFAQASGFTHDVVGAAVEVPKEKGPGVLESICECCLTMELPVARPSGPMRIKVNPSGANLD